MSELSSAIDDYLGSLALRDDSPHTLRNYEADLREFATYFSPDDSEPPALAELDLLALREWLAHLYEREQQPTTIRRKMASLRGLFRYLSREHRISRDPARLLRLPKMPKSLPQVPNAEVTNALVDGVGRDDLEQPYTKRDRLLFEMLYGCGLRISRSGWLEYGRYRSIGALASRARQRQEGAAGAVRFESCRRAHRVPD